EDRVVLGRPATAGARAVVVGPDQLIEELLAAEDLVEQQLAVVRLAVVDVEVQRAVLAQEPARLFQTRCEKAEVVVERVAIGGLCEQPRPVAPALKADALSALVADDRQCLSHL